MRSGVDRHQPALDRVAAVVVGADATTAPGARPQGLGRVAGRGGAGRRRSWRRPAPRRRSSRCARRGRWPAIRARQACGLRQAGQQARPRRRARRGRATRRSCRLRCRPATALIHQGNRRIAQALLDPGGMAAPLAAHRPGRGLHGGDVERPTGQLLAILDEGLGHLIADLAEHHRHGRLEEQPVGPEVHRPVGAARPPPGIGARPPARPGSPGCRSRCRRRSASPGCADSRRSAGSARAWA